MTTAARVGPATACDTAELHLPYQQQSAREARKLVRETLATWRLPELLDDAELIVSELVGNAVKTGCQRRMTVSLTRVTDTTVRIAVRDGSRAFPVLILDARPNAESGRGMALIHRLTRGHWGVDAEPLGKIVWADVRTYRKVP